MDTHKTEELSIPMEKLSLNDNNASPRRASDQPSDHGPAKMLIFLANGEQRLITFTIPGESCTLADILKQQHIDFEEDTHVQCMQNSNSEIDYFVSIGCTGRIEDLLDPLFRVDNKENS